MQKQDVPLGKCTLHTRGAFYFLDDEHVKSGTPAFKAWVTADGEPTGYAEGYPAGDQAGKAAVADLMAKDPKLGPRCLSDALTFDLDLSNLGSADNSTVSDP